eukprot:6180748-Pleurochrysis_carterae.AAC.4
MESSVLLNYLIWKSVRATVPVAPWFVSLCDLARADAAPPATRARGAGTSIGPGKARARCTMGLYMQQAIIIYDEDSKGTCYVDLK